MWLLADCTCVLPAVACPLTELKAHERVLQVKTLVAKLVGVVFSIAAGLIAGKEGPFAHGGGIVGGGLGGMGSQYIPLPPH